MPLGLVRTVDGDVSPEALGLTLPHEHIFVELWRGWFVDHADDQVRLARDERVTHESVRRIRRFAWSSRDNCTLDRDDVIAAEIGLFRGSGGGTLVDVTPPELGRDAIRVQSMAAATGVTVVMGCGHYVGSTHTSALKRMSIEAIAEELQAELTDGIEGTGVRAGLIGEIGTSSPIEPSEEKALKAAALAHRRTGAPISVHLSPQGGTGRQVVEVLEEAGADMAKVALGHLDGRDPIGVDEHLRLGETGARLEYDMFGSNWTSDDLREKYSGISYWAPPPSDQQRVLAMRELFDAGFGSQVLMSHDVCSKIQQAAWGGPGFELIPKYMGDFFVANGFSQEDFRRLTETNPQDWLTWTL